MTCVFKLKCMSCCSPVCLIIFTVQRLPIKPGLPWVLGPPWTMGKMKLDSLTGFSPGGPHQFFWKALQFPPSIPFSAPFLLQHTDLVGFHWNIYWNISFILLSCTEFYVQVSKGQNMESTEEKGPTIGVNFGDIGGHPWTDQLTNMLWESSLRSTV